MLPVWPPPRLQPRKTLGHIRLTIPEPKPGSLGSEDQNTQYQDSNPQFLTEFIPLLLQGRLLGFSCLDHIGNPANLRILGIIAVTTKFPLPFTTSDPLCTILTRSPIEASSSITSVFFSAASDSPESIPSLIFNASPLISLPSAGT